MSLRVAALTTSSWRITITRKLTSAHCRCYTESPSSPFQLDPLLADVLASQDPTHLTQSARKLESKTKSLKPVDPAKVNLPPLSEWRKHFLSDVQNNHRVSIRAPKSAASIAEAFVPARSRGKVIIEAFAGPGQLTRALLNLPKQRIKKLIVLEDYGPYLEYLRPLEAIDSRIKVIPIGGYQWDSYQTIQDIGLLDDVQKTAWEDGVHPQLQFISHLPSTVIGEQLIAQLFRSIPHKQWLFQYGRVPLNFILGEHVWKRIAATIEQPTLRCKVSVIAEAVAECSEALPFSFLQPFDEHFHPARPTWSITSEKKHDARRVGNPFQAISIVPLEHQAIKQGQLDKWDYCLRRLFVRKATPLKTALSSLAPGAQSLIKKVANTNLPDEERFDVNKQVRRMTVRDWTILLKAFDEWPFAPEDLTIGDTFNDHASSR